MYYGQDSWGSFKRSEMCNRCWAYDLEVPLFLSVVDHDTKGKWNFSLQKPVWFQRDLHVELFLRVSVIQSPIPSMYNT